MKTRFLSFFFVPMVIVMYLPLTELESANTFFNDWESGSMSGPNVLTNATVQFKDAETLQTIDKVDSGVPFKLEITIGGGNRFG